MSIDVSKLTQLADLLSDEKFKAAQKAVKEAEKNLVKAEEQLAKARLDLEHVIPAEVRTLLAAPKAAGVASSGRTRMKRDEAEEGKGKILGALSKSWKTKADIAEATGIAADFVGRVLDGAVKAGTAQAREKENHTGRGKAPKEYALKK